MSWLGSAAAARAGRSGRSGSREWEPATALSRLALIEDLQGSSSTSEAADRALAWLRAQGYIERGLCALVRSEQHVLEGIASTRLPPAEVQGFSVALRERDQPLVDALGWDGPLLLTREQALRHLPESLRGAGSALYAVPVRRESDGEAQGLLVVELRAHLRPGAEVGWAASQLAAAFWVIKAVRLSELEHAHDQERGHWRQVLEAIIDPILVTDADGHIVLANQQAEHLFVAGDGHSEGRRRAVQLNNMLFSAALFTTMDDGSGGSRELLLVDPSEGRDLVFELLRTPVPGARPGAGSGMISILRDIGDLRHATEALEEHVRKLRTAEAQARAERDRLDLILQSVADPVLVTDTSGNVTLLNPPAERFFSLDGVPGEAHLRRARSNDAVFTSFLSNLYAERGQSQFSELNLVDVHTGEVVRVDATAGKVLTKSGELVAVVTTLHDKTEALEKERLYEQVRRHSDELAEKVREATAELASQNQLLQRQALALEQASALKNQFLANMSHELRTPLTAILGYTELLQGGVGEDAGGGQRKKLARLEANAKHLLAIINDLLDIARIESGKMPLHLESFGFAELVSEVMLELEPIIPRESVEVFVDVEEGLPPLASDRQKAKQVLVNLVSNALKFTPAGHVRVSVRGEGARAVVARVEDTGIGIARQDLETIFEDFRQADSSDTRKYKGTGLGLSISRRLAQMLGGDITVESEVGRGSTFTLRLPLQARQS